MPVQGGLARKDASLEARYAPGEDTNRYDPANIDADNTTYALWTQDETTSEGGATKATLTYDRISLLEKPF